MKRSLKLFSVILAALIMLSALSACSFLANECTVTFDTAGGASPDGFTPLVKIKKGETVTLSELTKEGYTFLGWYNGNKKFVEGTAINTNLTLTAKWELKKVKVTFLDHYGQFIEEQFVDWGTSVTPPTVEEEMDGLPFKRWSEKLDRVTDDITVQALYGLPSYFITFDSKGGTHIDDQEVVQGKKPVKPADPEKTGFTFASWYLDKDFTQEYLFDTGFNEDITLYAKYIDDYTKIASAEDLKTIKDNPSGKYLLVADINLLDEKWESINDFAGVLDGNGHKIYNFSISGGESLMGFVNTNNGTVKNVNFEVFTLVYNRNCSDGVNAYSGVIAAKNNGSIKNCHVENGTLQMVASVIDVNKSAYAYFGGLVGLNCGMVNGCSTNIDISFSSTAKEHASWYSYSWSCDLRHAYLYSFLGGAVGENQGVLESTTADGTITSTATISQNSRGHAYNTICLGGIAGKNVYTSAKISECTSLVDIVTTYSGSATKKHGDFGLLVGLNQSSATIGNCVAEGSLKINNTDQLLTGAIGGAVGCNDENCTVINLFSDVKVTVSDAVSAYSGGLVGLNKVNAVLKKSVSVGDVNVGADVAAYGILVGSQSGTVHYCYYKDSAIASSSGTIEATECGEAQTVENLLTESFVFETLIWDRERWTVKEGENPSIIQN